MKNFRIIEFNKTFTIEIEIIVLVGFFGFKESKVWKPVSTSGTHYFSKTFRGKVFANKRLKPFKTLDEAKEQVKEFQKDKIIHNI